MRLSVTVVLLACVFASPARPETTLAGERDALTVTTHHATIEEVLGAFAAKFGLRYRATAPLTRQLNGSYACSLQRCLTQILSGYDYVIRSDALHIEVIVLGNAGAPQRQPASGAFAAHTARRTD